MQATGAGCRRPLLLDVEFDCGEVRHLFRGSERSGAGQGGVSSEGEPMAPIASRCRRGPAVGVEQGEFAVGQIGLGTEYAPARTAVKAAADPLEPFGLPR